MTKGKEQSNQGLNPRDVELLFELGTLRFIDRTWRQFLGSDFANLAEHTLRVTWFSVVIARYEEKADSNIKIDYEKLLKMALVHDLPESRTGDVHYVSRLYTQRDEEKAIEDILDGTVLSDDFVSLWKEYEKRECIEARIVKDADILEVDLELQEQAARGVILKNEWYENRKVGASQKLSTATGRGLWKTIYQSNPHDWHHRGKNRFTSGDWKPNNDK